MKVQNTAKFKFLALMYKENEPAPQPNAYEMMIGDLSQQEEAIVNLVQMDASMLQDPEVKQVYDAILARQQSPAPAAPNTPPVQQQPAPAGTPQQAQQQAHISQEEFVKTGLFFDDKKELDVESINEQNFKSFLPHVGIDASSPEWAKKLISDFYTASKRIEELSSYKEKFEKVDESIKALPTPLMHAIDTALKGSNWREAIQNFDIDYTKDWKDISVEERDRITKRLLPDLALDAIDKTSPQYHLALNLGKSAYEQHQKSVELEFESQSKRAQETQREYLASVGRSIAALEENYEEFKNKDNLKEVKEILEGRKFASLFYDNKGNLKPDAAEKLAFALYGKNVVSKVKGVAATKLANEKIAQVISGQQTKGGGTNGATSVTGNQEEAMLGQFTERAMSLYQQTY